MLTCISVRLLFPIRACDLYYFHCQLTDISSDRKFVPNVIILQCYTTYQFNGHGTTRNIFSVLILENSYFGKTNTSTQSNSMSWISAGPTTRKRKIESSETTNSDNCDCESSVCVKRNWRVQRHWMHHLFVGITYPDILNGVLCKYCVVFARECGRRGNRVKLGSLVSNSFSKQKNALETFQARTSRAERHINLDYRFAKIRVSRIYTLSTCIPSRRRRPVDRVCARV